MTVNCFLRFLPQPRAHLTVTEVSQTPGAAGLMVSITVSGSHDTAHSNPRRRSGQWEWFIQARAGHRGGGFGPSFWDGYLSLLWRQLQPGWPPARLPVSTTTPIRPRKLHCRRLLERCIAEPTLFHSVPLVSRPLVLSSSTKVVCRSIRRRAS